VIKAGEPLPYGSKTGATTCLTWYRLIASGVSQLKLIQQCGQMADRALELANDGKLKDAADLIVLAERQYKPISSQAGVNLNSCKPSKRKIKSTGKYIGSLLQINLFPE